jgi:sulfoxide reductase heme-binding subunit YedZ
MATGYVALLLLAQTLSLGAWNFIRGRVNPVSSDLRRDTGIWCGFFSLAHVAFGLNVHMQSWTQYFIDDSGNLRTDAFGFANYTGVAATILIILLLATSNDISIRFLNRDRWKAIQRLNYFYVILVVLHGVIYQFVENRLVPYSLYIGAFALIIFAFQIAGIQKKRHQKLEIRTDSQI